MFSARKAVMHYTQQKHIKGVTIEDIYIGNGVSELIVMAMNALLDTGDEVLVPAPDYPLWTAAVSLSGGTPRHYLCDEGSDWLPDMADIRAKITPQTRAIVIINPNNPTGALYPDDVLKEIIEIARQNDLIIYADEVYDKVLFDGASHTSIAALSEDVLTITFNGLSKNYRSCGYRSGRGSSTASARISLKKRTFFCGLRRAIPASRSERSGREFKEGSSRYTSPMLRSTAQATARRRRFGSAKANPRWALL